MAMRALVVPKQLKIGCCCYQQLTTVCHDPGNLGMALGCAPQRALFPDRPRRLDWQVLTADRGHSRERASVVTLVGLPKGGIAIRFAADDHVEVSLPPSSQRVRIGGVPGQLPSCGRHKRARAPSPDARPQPLARSRASPLNSPLNSLKERAKKSRMGRSGGGDAVRIGRIVVILICSLFVSGCVNHGKKLHKRADRDLPHSSSSPVVQVACAVPLLFHSGDSSTGSR